MPNESGKQELSEAMLDQVSTGVYVDEDGRSCTEQPLDKPWTETKVRSEGRDLLSNPVV